MNVVLMLCTVIVACTIVVGVDRRFGHIRTPSQSIWFCCTRMMISRCLCCVFSINNQIFITQINQITPKISKNNLLTAQKMLNHWVFRWPCVVASYPLDRCMQLMVHAVPNQYQCIHHEILWLIDDFLLFDWICVLPNEYDLVMGVYDMNTINTYYWEHMQHSHHVPQLDHHHTIDIPIYIQILLCCEHLHCHVQFSSVHLFEQLIVMIYQIWFVDHQQNSSNH